MSQITYEEMEMARQHYPEWVGITPEWEVVEEPRYRHPVFAVAHLTRAVVELGQIASTKAVDGPVKDKLIKIMQWVQDEGRDGCRAYCRDTDGGIVYGQYVTDLLPLLQLCVDRMNGGTR